MIFNKIHYRQERTVEDACPYNQERANTDCKTTDKSKFEGISSADGQYQAEKFFDR
ncbi:MAG: hypothetical protein J6B72_00050 [Clostridia bacterium]|nr:hypothetical protein [Clostridia bacterium]